MNVHGLGGPFNLVWVDLAKAGDVIGKAAFKKLHTLWQVAHVGAKLVLVPHKDIGAIKPHLTGHGRPKTNQHARERGLAACRGANNGKHFTRGKAKLNASQNRLIASWRARHQGLDCKLAQGCGQWHAGLARRNNGKQLVKTLVGVFKVHHAAPLGHQLRHGGKNTAAQR